MIDYITPNETELEALTQLKVTNITEAEKGAEVLLGKGIKNVIVTLGDKGALLKNSSYTKIFEGEKAKVVDTTAAGDSFNGALAVYLAEGNDIEASIRFANKVAARSVEHQGAQESIPKRIEVK